MTNTAPPLTADDRKSKIAKITALLCKTQARGCSAEEETAARIMADRLMAKYDIKESECVEQTARRSINNNLDDLFNDIFGFRPPNAASQQPQKSDEEKTREARFRMWNYTGRWDADWGPAPMTAPTHVRQPRPRTRPTAGPSYYQGEAGFYSDPSTSYGSASTGKRKNTSHKYCDHEATSSARAKCRKNRGF